MSKELVVELRIPLPTGLFEEADLIAKAKTAVDALRESVTREIGEGHTLTVTTTNRRATKVAANGGGQTSGRAARQPAQQPAGAAE